MDHRVFTLVNKLQKITCAYRSFMDTQVTEIDLPPTPHRILMYLSRKGNLPAQKELAKIFEITPAGITLALKKLEVEGYIERTDGKDHRFHRVTITDRGRALVERTRTLFLAAEDSIFSGFSEQEIDAFSSYLDRVIENLTGEAHEQTIPGPPVTRKQEIISRLRQLQHTFCPPLSQQAPLDVAQLYRAFTDDFEGAAAKYFEKRLTVTGWVIKMGPDGFGAPSIELSDRAGGHTYALVVFPHAEAYAGISLGDCVICTGNLLNAQEPYGSVIKNSTLQPTTSTRSTKQEKQDE